MKPDDDVQCLGTRRHQVDRMAGRISRERYAINGLLDKRSRYTLCRLNIGRTHFGLAAELDPEEIFGAVVEKEGDIGLLGL